MALIGVNLLPRPAKIGTQKTRLASQDDSFGYTWGEFLWVSVGIIITFPTSKDMFYHVPLLTFYWSRTCRGS